MVELEIVQIEKEEDIQLILGHAGFIKTAEDLYEAMLNAVPNVKFGLAFAEASGKKLIRTEGNDTSLEELAAKNLSRINAGHTFLILFKDAFPINVVKHIKDVNEVVRLYCATANPTSVVVAKHKGNSSVIGIIDGDNAMQVEGEQDRKERHAFLRDTGYKK